MVHHLIRGHTPGLVGPVQSVADLSCALARRDLGLPERGVLLGAGLQRLGQEPCRRERTQHGILIEESAEPPLPLPLAQVRGESNELLRFLQ